MYEGLASSNRCSGPRSIAMNDGACSNIRVSCSRSMASLRAAWTAAVVSVQTTSTPPMPVGAAGSSMGL
jgi:hypothetical protein